MASSSSMTCNYKLSCQCLGHSADVRGLAVIENGLFLSASRDKTTKVWKKEETTAEYTAVATLGGHTNFVSCVCYVRPCSTFKYGLIVTGGNDQVVCIFDPLSWQLINKLHGHTNTVCSLATSNNGEGTFLSASWDATARLWRNCVSEITLTGHQAAVWCAIDLPKSNIIVTGSADKTISLWTPGGQRLKTLTGHTDCVRGLSVLTTTDFLSCGNDATIRRWCSTTGDCLFIYYGHSNFIYSVVVGPTGEFVSSAEDGTIRIWGDSDASGSTGCLQTITLPAPTIWSVAYLPNGDILTGSSDGVIRIFTRDPARYAGDDAMEVFNEEWVACSTAAQEEIGGLKISD
ncbi:hypothetical protein J437_LFUL002521 [Ladona fulva]|uniref:Uncharacterized protein n=1 Tax=Ladona fulva TaxID=123851 RepID=A0A8K0P8U6_LADFU|nr:hypothetical protein J437_LFUL002521 [Ladona fulva]